MKKLTVLTGAGMSADSGLSTFRDSGGLWEGFDIEDVATPGAWKRNPEIVLKFYNDRRAGVQRAQPNAAHKALVKLESQYEVVVITQNIDDLHERAGSANILHLHGEITKAQSSSNPNQVTEIGYRDLQMGDKCSLGSQLRPHVVWFGEPVPMMEKAMQECVNASVFIVIGTSLAVYPAASLIHFVPDEAEKIIIDQNLPDVNGINVKKVEKSATIGVTEIVAELTG